MGLQLIMIAILMDDFSWHLLNPRRVHEDSHDAGDVA